MSQWTEQGGFLLYMGGSVQLAGVSEEQKGKGRVNSHSLSSGGAGMPIFSCPWMSELQILEPLSSGTCTDSLLGSQAFGLGQSHATIFPGLPACGQPIVSLLSSHKRVNQFP